VAELQTSRTLGIVNVTTDEERIRNIIYFGEPTGPERELAVCSFSSGHNIALFERDAAEVLNCTLYYVDGVELTYSRRS